MDKKIDETRNYLLGKIKQNGLISKKHKKACMALSYFERFLLFTSTVIGCVLISDFACIVGVPVGITSSAVGFKICAITLGIKKHQSNIKKKRKNNDKILLLAITKVKTIKVLISKF